MLSLLAAIGTLAVSACSDSMSESECIFSIYLETDLDVYGLVSTIANMGDEMMILGSRERSLK